MTCRVVACAYDAHHVFSARARRRAATWYGSFQFLFYRSQYLVLAARTDELYFRWRLLNNKTAMVLHAFLRVKRCISVDGGGALSRTPRRRARVALLRAALMRAIAEPPCAVGGRHLPPGVLFARGARLRLRRRARAYARFRRGAFRHYDYTARLPDRAFARTHRHRLSPCALAARARPCCAAPAPPRASRIRLSIS